MAAILAATVTDADAKFSSDADCNDGVDSTSALYDAEVNGDGDLVGAGVVIRNIDTADYSGSLGTEIQDVIIRIRHAGTSDHHSFSGDFAIFRFFYSVNAGVDFTEVAGSSHQLGPQGTSCVPLLFAVDNHELTLTDVDPALLQLRAQVENSRSGFLNPSCGAHIATMDVFAMEVVKPDFVGGGLI